MNWSYQWGGASRIARSLLSAAAALSLSAPAFAEVRHEGVWPEKDVSVTLDLERVPRDQAVKRLAKEAGWSVVVHAPAADPVDVHVKDQPASKVLDLLLMDAKYVATRDGSLIAIVRADSAAAASVPPSPHAAASPEAPTPPGPPALPEVPPVPAVPAIPVAPPPPDPPEPPGIMRGRGAHRRGTDRIVTGDSLTIEKNEVVHDVSVFGGSLKVLGKVTGDIAVMGGSATIREGGQVMGDASVFGGSLNVEDGARVDGDVEVFGGSVKKGDKAIIGGEMKGAGRGHGRGRDRGRGHDHDHDHDHDSDDHPNPHPAVGPGAVAAAAMEHAEDIEHDEPHDAEESTLAELASDAGTSISSMAMLFVFGAVLLALATRRMETLKVEIASRPMRSFAVGVVGVLTSIVVFIAMCVTIIGIPFALIGLLFAFVAVWAGVCAVLETAGGAVLGHKTKNGYVHLAAGCAMFLVLSAIPYVGGIVTAAVLLISIGALVSTRIAGIIPSKRSAQTNGGAVPYRSADTTA